MFTSADEARDYYDSLISDKRDIVIECDVVISALESAYDYIEGVLTEVETGDLLPTASSLEIDLFDRQMLISDRIGEREDMRSRAQFSADDLESERDDVVQGLEDQENDADAAEQMFDDVLGPVDNSGVRVYADEQEWMDEQMDEAARMYDEIFGPVDNSRIHVYADEAEWLASQQ